VALQTVTFDGESRLSYLGGEAFADCLFLSVIRIPASVQKICDECFSDCHYLWGVTFESGSNLSFVGDAAFQACASISSIIIPSSVEVLGRSCFRGCESLSSVTFESGSKLVFLGDDAFFACAEELSIWAPSSLHTLLHEYEPYLRPPLWYRRIVPLCVCSVLFLVVAFLVALN
jgi:hypothetical protein